MSNHKWDGKREPYCEACRCALSKVAGYVDWRCPKCHQEWQQPTGMSTEEALVGHGTTGAMVGEKRLQNPYDLMPGKLPKGLMELAGRKLTEYLSRRKTSVKPMRLCFDPLRPTLTRSHCYPEQCPVGCGVTLSRISPNDETIPVWRCAECTWTGTDRDRLEYLGEAVEDAVVERLGHTHEPRPSGVRIEEVEPSKPIDPVPIHGMEQGIMAPYATHEPLHAQKYPPSEVEVSILKSREPRADQADIYWEVCCPTCAEEFRVDPPDDLEDVRAELAHWQSGKVCCHVCGDNGSNGMCPACGRFCTDDTVVHIRERLVKTVARLYEENGRLRDQLHPPPESSSVPSEVMKARRLKGPVVSTVLGGKHVTVTVRIPLPDWHDMMRVSNQVSDIKNRGQEVTLELPERKS